MHNSVLINNVLDVLETIKKFRGGTVNQIINHTPSSTSRPLGGFCPPITGEPKGV